MRQYMQPIAGWNTPYMLDKYTEAMQEEEGALEAFRAFEPVLSTLGRPGIPTPKDRW